MDVGLRGPLFFPASLPVFLLRLGISRVTVEAVVPGARPVSTKLVLVLFVLDFSRPSPVLRFLCWVPLPLELLSGTASHFGERASYLSYPSSRDRRLPRFPPICRQYLVQDRYPAGT